MVPVAPTSKVCPLPLAPFHQCLALTHARSLSVYDSLFTRHWDEWKSTAGELEQLHVVQLIKSAGVASFSSDDEFVHVKSPAVGAGKWSFVEDGEGRVKVISPLKGTKLVSYLCFELGNVSAC